MNKYKTGDQEYDRIFENSLNGINPDDLTDEEVEKQERWIEENWEELNDSRGEEA
jgi:hypothetical protein